MGTLVKDLLMAAEHHGGYEEKLFKKAASEIERLHTVLIGLYDQIDIKFFTSDINTKEAGELITELEIDRRK